MPIKRSTLERKWYYRAAKTFFIILPLLMLIYLLLNQKADICSIQHSDIVAYLLSNIVYVIIGLIVYYLLIWGIWRISLYLFFGGLEDDLTKKTDNQPSKEPQNVVIVRTIAIIIIVLAILLVVLVKTGMIVLPQGGFDDWTNVNNNANANINIPHPGFCPATSKQTATPCHSVSGGVGVSGVIVKEPCKCPSDTFYSGTTDVITPGGPYLICTCK